MKPLPTLPIVLGAISASLSLGIPAFLFQPPLGTQDSSAQTTGLYARTASFKVTITDEDWHDAQRHRRLPVRLYSPVATDGQHAEKFPVIVFSHGLWASRESYAYFGRSLAAHGYIVIAPSHPGSDTAALRESMRTRLTDPSLREKNAKRRPIDRLKQLAEADDAGNQSEGSPEQRGLLMETVDDPANLRERPRDISFVIDEIARHNSLKNIADLSRIGVAGHSFGAYTAMAIGGMTVDLPGEKAHTFRDPRVKAVLPMSPEGAGTMGITPTSWTQFGTPVLFLTGTKDYGPGERAAAWRREAFDSIQGVDEYLVTLSGATHFTFADMGGATDPDLDRHVEVIKALALAFFDSTLRDDAAARKFLQVYSMGKHADGVAEYRPAACEKPAPR